MGRTLQQLGLNLRAGARLALFRRVAREDYVIEHRQVPLMLLTTLLATWLGQAALASPERPGSNFALYYAITAVALLAAATFVATSAAGAREWLTPAIIVMASPLPLLCLVLVLLSPVMAPPSHIAADASTPFAAAILASSAVALWQSAVTYRAIRLIFDFPLARSLVLTALLVLAQSPLGIMKCLYYYDTDEARARVEARHDRP